MRPNHKIGHKVFKEEGREEGDSESSILLMAQLWAQSGGTPPQEAGETDSDSAIYSPHVASGPTYWAQGFFVYQWANTYLALSPRTQWHARGKWPWKCISQDPHVVHAPVSFCRLCRPSGGLWSACHWRGLEERHLQEVLCFPVTLSSTPAFPLQSLHPGSQATDWLADRYVTS